jgi:hypothetical protein
VLGLIDLDDFREMFSISAEIAAGRLNRHLGAASRRLRGWVGAAVYEDAAAGTPVDLDRKSDLQMAEGALAMHFALLGLNTQLRHSGIVKTERVEGDTVISYLGPVELRQLTDQYLEQAEEVARPYMLSDATTEAAFGFVDAE